MTEPNERLDDFDRKILAALQDDATLSIAQLAEIVGLTSTPCWRRLHRLEERGIIKKRVTLLDPKALNLGITVFVMIRTSQHKYEWFDEFHRLVSDLAEVVDFYRVAGSIDYLLKAVVPDISAYDALYKELIKGPDLIDVTSMFVLEEIKHTTSLPLDRI